MKRKKVICKIVAIILFLFMSGFSSCDPVNPCWVCVNPHNNADWHEVCNSLSKNKWENYGYVCTQD